MDAVTLLCVFLLTVFIGGVAAGVYLLYDRQQKLSGHVDEVESKAAKALKKTADDTQFALSIKDRQLKTLSGGLDVTKQDVAKALGPRDAVYAKTSYANVVDTGNDVKDRQKDAGKIQYKGLSGDAVDIVGASASVNDIKTRKVRVWDQLRTDRVQLGDKWSLGVGGAAIPDVPDDMLVLMDKDGTKEFGGFGAKMLAGEVVAGELVFADKIAVTGGASEHNKGISYTAFSDPMDGRKNTIAGDTKVLGNVTTAGDLSIGRNANVSGRLHFGDATMDTAGSDANKTDPYYMQKVVDKDGNSSLRLTINDDDNERLDLYGGSCRIGDCKGPGEQVHSFDAAGNAYHKKSVQAGEKQSWLSSAPLAAKAGVGQIGASFGHQQWSHFPWSDGNTYIRAGGDNKSIFIGDQPTGSIRMGSGVTATTVRGTLSVEGGDDNKWNWIKVARENNDTLFFGGDQWNRGIWSEGARPFAVYTGGARRVNVTPSGQVQILGALQVCDANGNNCRNV